MATEDRAQECAATSTSDVNVFLPAETFSELIGLFLWSRPLMPYSHPVWQCPPEYLLRTGTHCTQDFKGWGQRIYKKTQDFSRLQSVDGLLDPAALVCCACAIVSNWSLAIKRNSQTLSRWWITECICIYLTLEYWLTATIHWFRNLSNVVLTKVQVLNQ